MGISIAYRGKLSSPALIPELLMDLRARSDAAGWRRREMAELIADGTVECPGLSGITLYPHPRCEPLRFHFDAEGVFVNDRYQAWLDPSSEASKMMREALAASGLLTAKLVAGADKKGKKRKKGGITASPVTLPDNVLGTSFLEQGRLYNWTKTQFAGPDVHIAICELLRHVKERYAPDLEVTDDGGYFHDRDRENLEAQLGHVDRMIGLTAAAFESAGGTTTSLGDLLERVNDELSGAKDKLH